MFTLGEIASSDRRKQASFAFVATVVSSLVLSLSNFCEGQTIPSNALLVKSDSLVGGEMARLGRYVYLSPDGLPETGSPGDVGEVTIPRFAASLNSMYWLGHEPDDSLSLRIEQDYWIVHWKSRPDMARVIVLMFDTNARLPDDVRPVRAAGDGSVFLPACLAITVGEKIRYEPQPFKNTVGYWVGRKDIASWSFRIEEAGEFNVEILQGCGQGQGGSVARLAVSADNQVQMLEFKVVETGHFQNFQWRHLGVVKLASGGVHTLAIEPINIKKTALMDVRAIHLIRLPK